MFKKRKTFIENKMKQNRNEIISLARKLGRNDLESEALNLLDFVRMKIQYKPALNEDVLEIEKIIMEHLYKLDEMMLDPVPKVVELYLDTIINWIEKRNTIKKEESTMFFGKKKKENLEKKLQEQRELELQTTILTYESKIMNITKKMDALIEKGKRPDIKSNSFEFEKLEREYGRLEDELKTYEEVIDGFYETIEANSRLTNMETLKGAIDTARRLRTKTFEEATQLVNEVQIERNIAEEEKTKFRELSQQFREGAPVKQERRKSSFADKVEERKVEELREKIEESNQEEELVPDTEEV